MDIDLNEFSDAMQPGQSGVYHAPEAIDNELLGRLATEIQDPERVAWRDGSDDFINSRGVLVEQRFAAYALKLKIGDREPLEKVPAVMEFAESAQQLVQNSLAQVFPNLTNWEADEAVLQRYPHLDGKLTFHKDNARHNGVIVIGTIEGKGDLLIKTSDQIHKIHTSLGSLVIVRATDLWEIKEDFRPEHAVSDITSPFRTSLTIRANRRPTEAVPGFSYDNWEAA